MQISDFQIESENGVIRGLIKEPLIKPTGVVLCLHGGPNGDLKGNNGIFEQLSEKVVELGFFVLQFSFYGSKPSDGMPEDISLRSQLADYNAVFKFAQERFNLPIHVIGESAGATVASLYWKQEPKSYILLWPAFDLRDTDLKPYLTSEWWQSIESYGFINDNGLIIGKEFFQELLLTDFSNSYKLPANDILIIHGQSDAEVPCSQSLEAIKNANGNLKFVTLKNAGHGFKLAQERQVVLNEVVSWLGR